MKYILPTVSKEAWYRVVTPFLWNIQTRHIHREFTSSCQGPLRNGQWLLVDTQLLLWLIGLAVVMVTALLEYCKPLICTGASQVALVVKNPSANTGDARDVGSVPRVARSPEEGNGNPLQYSCLENPMDRGTWWAIGHFIAESNMTTHTRSEMYTSDWILDINSISKTQHSWGEKRCGMYIYNGMLLSYKKKRWDPAIYYNMDGLWGDYGKWNKSEKDTYCLISLMWNIKVKWKQSKRIANETKVLVTRGEGYWERVKWVKGTKQRYDDKWKLFVVGTTVVYTKDKT